MANQNPNIERVLVGNENILRWDGQKELRDPNATSPAMRYGGRCSRLSSMPASRARTTTTA